MREVIVKEFFDIIKSRLESLKNVTDDKLNIIEMNCQYNVELASADKQPVQTLTDENIELYKYRVTRTIKGVEYELITTEYETALFYLLGILNTTQYKGGGKL